MSHLSKRGTFRVPTKPGARETNITAEDESTIETYSSQMSGRGDIFQRRPMDEAEYVAQLTGGRCGST
jgi:hypothetical protein